MSDLFILADYTLTAAHNTPNISGYFIQTGISFRALTVGQPAFYGNVFYRIYVTIVRCYLRNDLGHISYCCRILSWHFITSWLLIKHHPTGYTNKDIYIYYLLSRSVPHTITNHHPTLQIFSFSKSAVSLSSEYVGALL